MKKNPFADPKLEEIAFISSSNFLVIYNRAPILPGHSLVIPRREVFSLFDLTEAELIEMVKISRTAMQMLLKVFGGKSYNWTIQEGEAAGMSVPHLHLHLIPRQENDLPEPGDWYPRLEQFYDGKVIDSDKRQTLSWEEQKKIVERIKEIAIL